MPVTPLAPVPAAGGPRTTRSFVRGLSGRAFPLVRPSDIWHKPALSAVVTTGVVNLTLLAIGRLDLALFAAAGALCSLYAHGLPYRVRARTLALVCASAVAGTGLALTAAAYVRSMVLLVVIASVLAALYKVGMDAARLGPPGAVIVTFTTASCVFSTESPAAIPAHLGVTVAGAALAWIVCMAPGAVRPHGPERIATARALGAAAKVDTADPEHLPAARAALAGAVNAAWHTLASSGPPAPTGVVAALESLLVRAERAHVDGAPPLPYARWARDVRGRGPLPEVAAVPEQAAALRRFHREQRRRAAWTRHVWATGSPWPTVGLRVASGCTMAGLVSLACGVGRPYWAIVTAASVFQASTLLSGRRAWQRVLGNLLGLAVFTALLPISRTGAVALVLIGLVCQFGAEATITRGYWLGSVFVTPMALSMVELAGYRPAGELIADRWLDTCVGAAVGLIACLPARARHPVRRVHRALAATGRAAADADAVLAGPTTLAPAPHPAHVRARLSLALVELREAADLAGQEPRRRAGTHDALAAVADAHLGGHRRLAALVAHADARPPDRRAVDA